MFLDLWIYEGPSQGKPKRIPTVYIYIYSCHVRFLEPTNITISYRDFNTYHHEKSNIVRHREKQCQRAGGAARVASTTTSKTSKSGGLNAVKHMHYHAVYEMGPCPCLLE